VSLYTVTRYGWEEVRTFHIVFAFPLVNSDYNPALHNYYFFPMVIPSEVKYSDSLAMRLG
jgi:FMN-dependent NADH-azoreductase